MAMMAMMLLRMLVAVAMTVGVIAVLTLYYFFFSGPKGLVVRPFQLAPIGESFSLSK